jgi:hypothetical protein
VYVQNSTRIAFLRPLVDRNNRYFSSVGLNFINVNDSQIVDAEIYDFAFVGLEVSGSNVDVRRAYVNSRATPDIEGGVVTADPSGGDIGIAGIGSVGGSTLFENVVAENVQSGLAAAGSNGSVTFLGSIALDCQSGGYMDGYNAISIRDWVSVNRSPLAGQGIFFRAYTNATVWNATTFKVGGAGFLNGGMYLSAAGHSSVMVNSDLVQSAGFGMQIQDGGWTIEYSNAAGTVGADYTPALDAGAAIYENCNSSEPSLVGLGNGDCVVYVPPASNMFDAGKDGAPIGANIIYRYEDGGLTDAKLWSEGGSFPCGAVRQGINDDAGASCQGVGARLNFVDGGCPVP